MTETLVKFFVNLMGGNPSSEIGKVIIISILSMLPVIELRGGLIAGALLDVNSVLAFIICYLFNLLPIPFILLLVNFLFEKLKKTKSFSKMVTKLEQRVEKKKGTIEKYGYLGLFLFVAIPLPGTGAWTGALIASVLEMNKKKSFLVIAIGVLVAGLIMMLLSYGLLKGIIG